VIKVKTTITKRGQTTVPAKIIKKYNLKTGSKLYWLDTGRGIKVIPISDDIINTAYGIAEGQNLLEELIQSRKKDKINEN